MKYESLDKALEDIKKLQRISSAYNHVLGITYLDAATSAPKGSWEGRGQTMAVLSEITYQLIADDNNGDLLCFLEAHAEELDAQTKREVEMLRKQYDQIHRIPAQEYIEYNVLLNDAQMVWEKAKNSNDFASFAPYLERIVEYNRRFAGYYNPDMQPYDALLNEYEEGLNMKTLDAFFEQLRSVVVPLLSKINEAPQIDDSFLYSHYPIDQQRQFSEYLMDVLGLDREYCGIAETEHPFTTNFNNRDVRITTHYHENNLASSMYSVIHEGGHALYELGCDGCYNHTFLSGGVSMGIHESQSRFYENIIGRSKAFIELIYPRMQALFPEQLQGVTADMFYRAVNKAEPSLIRTESDELTYCLHVIVRYEIEKQLMAGTLSVNELPEKWNLLYKDYLGVDVPSDTMGCLQDSHWSGGSIGYFPSYALGSAYGPQILTKMKQDIPDLDDKVKAGKLAEITKWLQQNIHRHACFYKPGELFEMVCGKFDPEYYIAYLRNKYSELYEIH